MSLATKVVVEVLDIRLKRKFDETVDDVQFRLGKELGLVNAAFMLKIVVE